MDSLHGTRCFLHIGNSDLIRSPTFLAPLGPRSIRAGEDVGVDRADIMSPGVEVRPQAIRQPHDLEVTHHGEAELLPSERWLHTPCYRDVGTRLLRLPEQVDIRRNSETFCPE